MIEMEYQIGRQNTKETLFRLKKAIQFIKEVVNDHKKKPITHMSFALMLAISKADELRDQVDSFCPAYRSFQELSEMLRYLPNSYDARVIAERCLEHIRDYFELEKIELRRKERI